MQTHPHTWTQAHAYIIESLTGKKLILLMGLIFFTGFKNMFILSTYARCAKNPNHEILRCITRIFTPKYLIFYNFVLKENE